MAVFVRASLGIFSGQGYNISRLHPASLLDLFSLTTAKLNILPEMDILQVKSIVCKIVGRIRTVTLGSECYAIMFLLCLYGRWTHLYLTQET